MKIFKSFWKKVRQFFLRACLFSCLVLVAVSGWRATAGGEKITTRTPPPGSAERKAILDALRNEMRRIHGLQVVFVVQWLKVCNGWAWVQTLPQSPDGRDRFEDISALLAKGEKGWRVVELPCFEVENADCIGAPEYFLRLKKRFPELPDAILPPERP